MTMPCDKPVRRIAFGGIGVIGASWASQYLARGFDVTATDPAAHTCPNDGSYHEES
jgi:carnitine 3-dehydrogenase